MSLYGWGILLITATSSVGLVLIVLNYDPHTAGKIIKFLFFGSLGLVLVSLILGATIILKTWKKNLSK